VGEVRARESLHEAIRQACAAAKSIRDKFIEAAWAWLAWDTEKLPAQ